MLSNKTHTYTPSPPVFVFCIATKTGVLSLVSRLAWPMQTLLACILVVIVPSLPSQCRARCRRRSCRGSSCWRGTPQQGYPPASRTDGPPLPAFCGEPINNTQTYDTFFSLRKGKRGGGGGVTTQTATSCSKPVHSCKSKAGAECPLRRTCREHQHRNIIFVTTREGGKGSLCTTTTTTITSKVTVGMIRKDTRCCRRHASKAYLVLGSARVACDLAVAEAGGLEGQQPLWPEALERAGRDRHLSRDSMHQVSKPPNQN